MDKASPNMSVRRVALQSRGHGLAVCGSVSAWPCAETAGAGAAEALAAGGALRPVPVPGPGPPPPVELVPAWRPAPLPLRPERPRLVPGSRACGLHFFFSHDMRRLRRDDDRAQPVAFMEVGQLRRLAGAHDLDAALVDIPLGETSSRPRSVRTMRVAPDCWTTVPFFTSVTVTGVTVVRVVTVAVPFIPTFRSRTASYWPLTVKRKSSGTVSSLVPSGSLTSSWLPSTARISNVLVSVVVDCLLAPARDRGQTQERRGQDQPTHCTCHRTLLHSLNALRHYET